MFVDIEVAVVMNIIKDIHYRMWPGHAGMHMIMTSDIL